MDNCVKFLIVIWHFLVSFLTLYLTRFLQNDSENKKIRLEMAYKAQSTRIFLYTNSP